MKKIVKNYTNYQALKNFSGYLNIQNITTKKRITLFANNHFFAFEISRFQNAKIHHIEEVNSNNITLYITNTEWKKCTYSYNCDDFGYPLDYFD